MSRVHGFEIRNPKFPLGALKEPRKKNQGMNANVAEITRLRPDLPESQDYAVVLFTCW